MNKSVLQETRLKEYQSELLEQTLDPVHKRLVKAYQLSRPVESMEDELTRLLLEVLRDED